MSALPARIKAVEETDWKFEDAWQLNARCAGADPSIFHDLMTAPQRRRAQEFCAGCPVKDSCLEHALCSPWEPSGIWGGYPQKDLQRMWRERHPMTSPTERYQEAAQLIGLVS